jgi:hypothetical protein
MEALPYVVAATPLLGSLVTGSVPVLMLLAFVASVVADRARPLTALDVMAMAVLVTPVTLPQLSTLKAGMLLPEP